MSTYTFKTEVAGMKSEVIGQLVKTCNDTGVSRLHFEIFRIIPISIDEFDLDQIKTDILTDIEQRAIVQLDKDAEEAAEEGNEYE